MHRIIPEFVVHGGDFIKSNGTGWESIYGSNLSKFDDENFDINHEPFSLWMANSGPNTNGSQFYITLVETPWLDGVHVVFGKVVEGIEVVKLLENQGSDNGQPQKRVKIIDWGEL